MVIGTTNTATDVVSPLSAPTSGIRFVADWGTHGQVTEAKIVGLPDDTYHWGIQTIDQDFDGSGITYGSPIKFIKPLFIDNNSQSWSTLPGSGLSKSALAWADFDGDGNVDETTAGGASVQYEFDAETVYGVTMTAENGCGESTTSQNVLVQDVSVEELKNEIGFNVYPNPVQDNLTLLVSDNTTNVLTLSIADVQGRLVQEIPVLNHNRQVLNLDQLPTGIYVLQVNTTKGLINQRIIKQ